MSLYGLLVPLVFFLAPVGVVVAIVWLGRKIHFRHDRKSPISRDLLRGPGHTVSKQLEEVRSDLLAYFATVSPIPLFLLATWALQDRANVNDLGRFPFVFIVALVAGTGWLTYKLSALVRRARDLSLGFEAETAAGQELNQLLHDGFEVFHDVTGDNRFNIDHVVVGRAGVFAIETKGRSKPIKNGKAQYKVQVDGDLLIFPTGTEAEPLIQAKRNADWLGKWLSSATGELTIVKPVLILPGWWVDRKSQSDVVVLSGSNCRQVIPKIGASALTEQQVRRIAHQLDARCRDVAPQRYS